MNSLYKHSPKAPFHISVGAVLVNEKGQILVHKMRREKVPEKHRILLGGLNEIYLLMRESLENSETIEEGVLRGLQEEFGAEGVVEKYLGSIQVPIPDDGGWEKTTLYFQVRLTKQGIRPPDDAEAFSDLEWLEPAFVAEKMREQGKRATRADLDESKVVDAHIRYS